MRCSAIANHHHQDNANSLVIPTDHSNNRLHMDKRNLYRLVEGSGCGRLRSLTKMQPSRTSAW
jgi:hypothetical protein